MKRGRKFAWPRIRKRRNPSGVIAYRVDAGKVGGKRVIKQFKTPEDADKYAAELREQRAAEQEAARFERKNRAVSLANLNDEQRADVLSAYRALGSTRGTLTATVKFWLQHSTPATTRTCSEVLAELLQACITANRRPRTLINLRYVLTNFCTVYGAQPVASVTIQDLQNWLEERVGKLAPTSRGRYRVILNRLFAFAVKRGYREGNPISAIERPTFEETVPEVLTPDEVRILMNAAQTKVKRIIPYLAIGLFAGLRTENELRNLDWRMIDLNERTIEVTAATAKKRRHRTVEISDNLLQWLAPHRQDSGKIYFTWYAFNEVREVAGIRWPRNVMRHSFASYHLAMHNDAGKTALLLGHPRDIEMLFRHYRRMVKASDAAAYWNIRPEQPANIIQLNTAAG
jgi:site-specific recombinase XerD